jgi:hypothetical protein
VASYKEEKTREKKKGSPVLYEAATSDPRMLRQLNII